MTQRSLFDHEPDPWELDALGDTLVASVVLPEEPFGPFDYRVPDRLRGQVAAGHRVRVPLGKANRLVVGYCVRLGPPGGHAGRLKDVHSAVDPEPLAGPAILRLTEWMADYYLCRWGQVLEAVIPAGVRAQAGTRQLTYLDVPTEVAARLSRLELPPKQLHALRTLLGSPQPLTPPELAERAQCTQAPISQLRRKGLIRATVRRTMDGRAEPPAERLPHLQLNDQQQAALDSILAALRSGQHSTLLLHGITGSGKTEVYIQAIDQVVRDGRQAIVLVPEISLTPQTRQRFRSRFDHVAVLHSMLTGPERHWHWQRIAQGEVQVVVGARSAVFAPVPRLGLIVLDEEHDASFKQDKLPRYHARDVALQRARLESIPLLLGSATPSLESWHQAGQGEYRLLSLPQRVENRPLPDVAALDLRTEYRSRASRGAVSRPLHRAIEQALRDDGQVILLLNRRGFSTSIQCPACGHVVNCPDCDIALTHHAEGDKAVCHYCDYQTRVPERCPECRFDGIRFSGLGTQKLEREIQRRFPQVPSLRVDSDTMRRPGSHEEALARFRRGEIKILLGTQMIAKGLDFPNVTLVGVVNADTALHLPDFRASERTFQLVTQVAGRTGRGEKGGRVLVQTFSPEHPAIQAALRHDYLRFAAQELPVRQRHGYPPVSAMIRIIARGPRERAVEQFAELMGQRLRDALASAAPDHRLLGPAPAPVAKLRRRYRFHMLLIGPRIAALQQAVRSVSGQLPTDDEIQWVADVDPLDMQ
ncbi:MAG: primosomal protein N' [Pirellulaceae bacterium]|nr:primosomal protein N' [Pirellulaceae bacterium]